MDQELIDARVKIFRRCTNE